MVLSLKKIKRKNKRAALELSIGTIVILVLAMSMLILGLILIRTIFSGAKFNVETMNKKVEAEINKLFVEDQRAVIYLPNRIALVKQGSDFGLGFGINNIIATQEFSWKIKVPRDDRLSKKCGFSNEDKALDWITTGGTGKVRIGSGQKYTDIVRFNIPEGAISDISTCIIRFQLVIEREDREIFTTESFDVDVQ
jgi:hypothetical protein|tara:strand:+ start:65 stop:649 length:585 start_codon:yes stop_codon:yes gene_type:complete